MFNTLYKKTSTGAIQQWNVSVYENPDSGYAYTINTSFGQVDGKIQETFDTIFEGKNLGKVNETTVKQQAEAEAQAMWQKKKDSGYVESIEDAEAGVTEVAGYVPMLAQPYEKHHSKIEWPACIQPKLDGIRCCAIIEDGEVSLFSRTGKPINAVPHIEAELSEKFPTGSWKLDGELYNHDLKDNFEKLLSIVRKQKEIDTDRQMQYHIYDMNMESTFINRIAAIAKMIPVGTYLRVVPTEKVADLEAAEAKMDDFIAMGYEGSMLRNKKSQYESKRSYNLQKMKKFLDEEYKIIGIEEGRGKLMGHAATFVCETTEGNEFKAKMIGSQSRLKEFFEDHTLWQGKKLTVKFFEYTSKNNVPRFPVGIAIRDYE